VKNLLIAFLLACVCIMSVLIVTPVRCQTPDPSPRFQLLGSESLEAPNIGQATRATVYRDRAYGEEIICFSGTVGDVMLSCVLSGRNRGTR
jgi:hypothetical protein